MPLLRVINCDFDVARADIGAQSRPLAEHGRQSLLDLELVSQMWHENAPLAGLWIDGVLRDLLQLTPVIRSEGGLSTRKTGSISRRHRRRQGVPREAHCVGGRHERFA